MRTPRTSTLSLLLLGCGLLFSQASGAATEIALWHAMQGAPAQAIERLAERFNAAQSAWQIVPSYHGSDEQTLDAGLAAARQGQGPHLLQVAESGAADMLNETRLVKPLYQLAADARLPLERNAFIPASASLYSDSAGRLMALPFNGSTPILLYSREAFVQAGLDPDHPPKSWYELQPMLLKLQDAGSSCPYTTSWQTWIHLINVSAWHNFPLASANNGYGAGRPELLFNTHLMIRHISLLSAWFKSDLFSYSGRGDAGDARFASGECAILTTSSSAYPDIRRSAGFTVMAAPLPHYDDFSGAPYNTLLGGGALWAMAGKPAADYAGVAQFLKFLESPEALEEWHRSTGFAPVTRAAESTLRKSDYFSRNPLAEIVTRQWQSRSAGSFARGVRLRHFGEIRGIVDEELEAVWNNLKPPKLALDDAVERGNALLRRLLGVLPAIAPARAAAHPAAHPTAPAKPGAAKACSGCR